MTQNHSKTKFFLRSLFLVLGFTAFLILTFAISWKYAEKQAEQDFSNTKPVYFPVVVVTENKSELVLTRELENYIKENPNYSFLIPKEKEGLINEQLKQDQIRRNGKGTPQIRVEQIADGKQLIEFEIIGDGLFLSRYEVKDKELKPLMLKLSGPGIVFLPCGITFLVGFIGIFLLRFIIWFIKKRQKVEIV